VQTVKDDRRGVGARFPGEAFDACTFGPHGHLLDGRGPIRVSGNDERLVALASQAVGELADGRRLAGAIHPI
jgi:hypothetical protein